MSSENSLDVYSDNTSSNFSNVLPKILTTERDEKMYIKLVGIGMSNICKHPLSYVNVHLKELEPQRAGREFNQIIGGFAYPLEESDAVVGYGLHTFKHPVLLPLKFEELDSLQVRLSDEFNQDIELDQQFSTLIWFEITDEGMEDQFVMACTSRHPTLYPSNELGEFTVPLPSVLNLPNYEVALLNVLYPPSISDAERNVSFTVEGNNVADEFVFDLSMYRTTEDFVEAVQEKLRYSVWHGMVEFDFSTHRSRRGRVYFYYTNMGIFDYIKIVPSRNFTLACGQLQQPLGEIKLTPNGGYIFKGVANIFFGMPHPIAMIECDIIKPTVTTGDHANLLQFAPVLKSDGESKLYEPERLIFHAVVDRPITSVKFTFREPNGVKKELQADNPEHFMLINLQFRMKKMSLIQ